MTREWRRPPRLRVGEAEEGERRATWLELFYDLVYVVAVAELAHRLRDDPSGRGMWEFALLFVPVWWAWVGYTFFANRFDSDDVWHRVATAAQMLGAGALAINVRDGLGDTSAGFALAYAAVRLVLVLEYLRAARHVPEARPLIRRYAPGFAAAAGLWAVSAAVPAPWRFVLWGVGLVVDFGTPLSSRRLQAKLPPDASHLPERFGLFTIIVLGEAVAGVVRGVGVQEWGAASAVAASLGLAAAFSLWWVYFDSVDGSAIKRTRLAGQVWIYAHLLLMIGLAAVGVAVQLAVQAAAGDPLPDVERWLLCGAAALCLLSIAVVHMTTHATMGEARNEIETPFRLGGAAVLLLAGAFGGALDPLLLTGLVAVVCACQILADVPARFAHQHHEPAT